MWRSSSSSSSTVRHRVLGFLIQSADQLEVRPIVKYTALSLFADRFFSSLPRYIQGNGKGMWLLQPVEDSNLQLFALISIWISSKMHESCPISVKSLKSFGDKMIKEQHFTNRDLLEAEVVFMQVLNFNIGASNIAFVHLEELFIQFKSVARIGELVNFGVAMDILDLLYEKDETSTLFSSPCPLAASILVASYLITVPKQRWEFPLLPWGEEMHGKDLLPGERLFAWENNVRPVGKTAGFNVVKYVSSCNEEDIVQVVRDILKHVFSAF